MHGALPPNYHAQAQHAMENPPDNFGRHFISEYFSSVMSVIGNKEARTTPREARKSEE